jgi:hypothetical protein
LDFGRYRGAGDIFEHRLKETYKDQTTEYIQHDTPDPKFLPSARLCFLGWLRKWGGGGFPADGAESGTIGQILPAI